MAAHSRERKMERCRPLNHFWGMLANSGKATNVHLEANPRTTAKEDRRTDVVLPLTEPVTLCCILSMGSLSAIIPTTSLNISPWTC